MSTDTFSGLTIAMYFVGAAIGITAIHYNGWLRRPSYPTPRRIPEAVLALGFSHLVAMGIYELGVHLIWVVWDSTPVGYIGWFATGATMALWAAVMQWPQWVINRAMVEYDPNRRHRPRSIE